MDSLTMTRDAIATDKLAAPFGPFARSDIAELQPSTLQGGIMYQPMVLEQLVAQHANELYAEAAEQRLARQCRNSQTPRHGGPVGRHISRRMLKWCRPATRRAQRPPMPDQPTVLQAHASTDRTPYRACRSRSPVRQTAPAGVISGTHGHRGGDESGAPPLLGEIVCPPVNARDAQRRVVAGVWRPHEEEDG